MHRQRQDLVGDGVLGAQLVRAAAHRVRHARQLEALLWRLAAAQRGKGRGAVAGAHQAQHQRAARHHALAARQLDAREALQHGGLARGLVAHHGDLGELDAVGAAAAGAVQQNVAQLVHRVKQGADASVDLVAKGLRDGGGGAGGRGGGGGGQTREEVGEEAAENQESGKGAWERGKAGNARFGARWGGK